MKPVSSEPLYEGTKAHWDNQWAHTSFNNELTSLSYPRWREIFDSFVPLMPKNEYIIEAGCGVGHIVWYLQNQGYQALGMDYTSSALRVGHDYSKEIPFLQGDIHSLPFADETVGAYLSFGVLEHFEFGPLPALSEAYRVLKPGGLLVLSIPHPNFGEQWKPKMQTLEDWLHLNPLRRNKSLRRIFKKPLLEKTHTSRSENMFFETRYTHQEVERFVQQVGFKILEIKPVGHGFSWYLFSSVFRKKNAYYETTFFGDRWANVVKRIVPWSTCFSSLTLAQKS